MRLLIAMMLMLIFAICSLAIWPRDGNCAGDSPRYSDKGSRPSTPRSYSDVPRNSTPRNYSVPRSIPNAPRSYHTPRSFSDRGNQYQDQRQNNYHTQQGHGNYQRNYNQGYQQYPSYNGNYQQGNPMDMIMGMIPGIMGMIPQGQSQGYDNRGQYDQGYHQDYQNQRGGYYQPPPRY